MTEYIKVGNLQVASNLYRFINEQALPGSLLSETQFWSDFEQLIDDLYPENRSLLNKREKLQSQVDEWHESHASKEDHSYKEFLKEIGYLEEEVEDFAVTTSHVDEEITSQAGPQLVVPVDNARYALNAANARWGVSMMRCMVRM